MPRPRSCNGTARNTRRSARRTPARSRNSSRSKQRARIARGSNGARRTSRSRNSRACACSRIFRSRRCASSSTGRRSFTRGNCAAFIRRFSNTKSRTDLQSVRADYKSAPRCDHIGAFAVSGGFGLKELVEKFKAEHDDYNAIMAEALADRFAEAFAECLHKRVRDEWGYGRDEGLSREELIEEKYRGIRPAAGYPACPDHTEKGTLWQLLDVEKTAGILLTESFAMWPGSSVSGLYFAHPQARYFGLGKIDRDQVDDYHLRKDMTVQEIERWLGPNLNYDAAAAFPASVTRSSRAPQLV